jgi:hypothetical protein
MPLHYVDPHNEHGLRYRAVESFGRSRPGQFVSRHVFFRIDPSRVQGPFHIARCKPRIMPAQ